MKEVEKKRVVKDYCKQRGLAYKEAFLKSERLVEIAMACWREGRLK